MIILLSNYSNIALPSPALHLWSLKLMTQISKSYKIQRKNNVGVKQYITDSANLFEDLCKDHGKG